MASLDRISMEQNNKIPDAQLRPPSLGHLWKGNTKFCVIYDIQKMLLSLFNIHMP